MSYLHAPLVHSVGMVERILVTGAGGYIGRHVVKALLDDGQDVIASDLRLNDVDDRAEHIETNLFESGSDIYSKLGKPDVCLHMAWRDGFKHNSDNHMGDLSAHYRFIKNMLDGGLPQIAVMGTMHEVGYWEGAIDEHTPCHPASMYGIAKNALREATLMLAQEHNAAVQWLHITSSETIYAVVPSFPNCCKPHMMASRPSPSRRVKISTTLSMSTNLHGK